MRLCALDCMYCGIWPMLEGMTSGSLCATIMASLATFMDIFVIGTVKISDT